MKFRIRLRLIALGIAVALMGTLIVLITLNSQRQVSELRAQLSSVDSESSGIRDQFKECLRQLNSAMLRYGTERDPLAWQAALKAGDDLNHWIETQKSQLRSPAEIELLQQIQTTRDNYWLAARKFHTIVETSGGDLATLDDFNPVRKPSQQLFDLGQSLAHTHFLSQDDLLRHANRSLEQLHLSVLALLGLLFVFGVILAVNVYRHLIAPLRVRLVETQAFAEQREELASLGLLASGVAHEVRHPLTSIKIGMFLQKKKFPPGTPERADAEVVEREIFRLERILDDFLAFTRPSEPEMAPLQLDPFLRELRQFFKPQLAGFNIQLITEILAPIQVRADAAQLKQVIVNLMQNAVNSIGRDGRITLRARPDRKMLAGNETDVAVLEVADTGKGIPPDVEKQLFRPFFTTKKDGTGLGLSIAAQIVRRHGGELQYQTEVNHGTIFGIVLPQIVSENFQT